MIYGSMCRRWLFRKFSLLHTYRLHLCFSKFLFLEQLGIILPSMEHCVYCFPYVTDHKCKSITIRKCNVILSNGCMKSFYVTDCWKNVNFLLLIELKRNCDAALILTSETVNYTFSKPTTSWIINFTFMYIIFWWYLG